MSGRACIFQIETPLFSLPARDGNVSLEGSPNACIHVVISGSMKTYTAKEYWVKRRENAQVLIPFLSHCARLDLSTLVCLGLCEYTDPYLFNCQFDGV